MELLNIFRTEWSALAAAPWAFSLVLVTAFGLAFAACRWAYQSLLETNKSRLEALKERLSAKDDQLAEYRERLKLVPSNGSKFSRLTQKELQDQALTYVEGLRTWLAKSETETRAIADQQWHAMTRAKSEEERRQLWEAHSSTHTSGFQRLMQDFEQKFKVDAILLRDELNTRLPAAERNTQLEHHYELPVNTFCIRAIADDLERRAKLLR
jgi:hypothetical protein